MYKLVGLFAVVCIANAKYTSLQYSQCGSTAGRKAINIESISVSPMPVMLPGDMQMTMHGNLTRQVSSSSLSIQMSRHTFLGNIHVPCIAHVGSCTYPDICTMVDQMINEDWAGVMGGIGTQVAAMLKASGVTYNACPQPAQRLDVESYTIHLPKVPAILSWFASGDYHAHITATETSTGEEVLCLDLDLSIDEPCSGLGCLFG